MHGFRCLPTSTCVFPVSSDSCSGSLLEASMVNSCRDLFRSFQGFTTNLSSQSNNTVDASVPSSDLMKEASSEEGTPHS